jgi:hypothetical protein
MGGPHVSAESLIEGPLAAIIAPKNINGAIPPDFQLDLNTLCASARLASIEDVAALEEAYTTNGLRVDCQICPQRKKQ